MIPVKAQKPFNTKQTQSQLTVVVGSEIKQKLRFGVDAERLWYWKSGLKDQLAQLAVGDLKSEFVRVAINCAYEREKGVKKDSAYDQILEMMTAMKKANPQIKFFATPRPLGEAYTSAEQLAIFGTSGCPWAPYPGWIMGFSGYGGIFGGGGFNVDEAIQYLADYLNLMYSKGFLIDFMDLTQEKEIITPSICKYIYDNLPSKLNTNVKMPLLVVPSSWSCYHATEWLKTVNLTNGELDAFGIAATHNTSPLGSPVEFATSAAAKGKEVWNTELHGWVGDQTQLRDEVLTSSFFWDYIQAGFSGIDTWLFFGPYSGKGQTMIWSNTSSIQKSAKYEIFKKVVNAANGGNYVPTNMAYSDSVYTTFFIKDGIYSGTILNMKNSPMGSVKFEFPVSISGMNVEVTRWNQSLPRSGKTTYFTVTDDKSFIQSVEGASLYFFRISNDLIPSDIADGRIDVHFENNDIADYFSSIKGSLQNQNPMPAIVSNPYKNGINLTDSCIYVRTKKDLTSSPKVPAWSSNYIQFDLIDSINITDNNRYFHIFHWKGQKLNNWVVYASMDGTNFKEVTRGAPPAAQTWFDIVADIKTVFTSIKSIRVYLDGNWGGTDDVRYYNPTDFYYDEMALTNYPDLRISASTAVQQINQTKISLYPNPAKDYLYIKSESPLKELSIKNINGIQVISLNQKSIIDDKINISGLNKGIYIIELFELNNTRRFFKFVKQ